MYRGWSLDSPCANRARIKRDYPDCIFSDGKDSTSPCAKRPRSQESFDTDPSDTEETHNVEDQRGEPGPSSASVSSTETYVGVYKAPWGKWYGQVKHPLANTSGKRKTESTTYYRTKEEAAVERQKLKERIEKDYWDSRTELAAEDPLTRNLSRGPENVREAKIGQVYWVASRMTNHIPKRMLPSISGRSNPCWVLACQRDDCASKALQSCPSKGGKVQFCMKHGGTACAHGPDWTRCLECNATKSGKARSNMCKSCKGVWINSIRSHGSGMCASCEDHHKKKAAENGSDVLWDKLRYEDRMLEGTNDMKGIIRLVTDEKDRLVGVEMRDDRTNMLGSNNLRRRGECDTQHQRRPDVMWIKRDNDNRICAVVMVEIDEDSHETRTSVCEGGKVDDTFQCILQLAQTEGKARLAVVRKGEVRPPYVLFLRVNPNACDAKGSVIRLQTRVEATAAAVKEFLLTPESFFHDLADAGDTRMPHVQCMYYHTKKGADHLAFYQSHHGKALYFHGNACPRQEGEMELFPEM